MNFYLYNGKVTPETNIPLEVNKSELQNIAINDEILNPAHSIDISTNENSIVVKVGKNETHPQNDEESIEWIMLEVDNKIVNKIELNKNAEPMAVFMIQDVNMEEFKKDHVIVAYACCAKTGIWKNKLL